MNKFILIFFLILSSCVELSTQEFILNQAMENAITKIEPTQCFTVYSSQIQHRFSHLDSIMKMNLYINSNNLKQSIVTLYDGKETIDEYGNMKYFQKEIVSKLSTSAEILYITNFSLKLIHPETKKITYVVDKKGFNAIYKLTYSTYFSWDHNQGEWHHQDEFIGYSDYFLVKSENDQKQLKIHSVLQDPNDGSYIIFLDSVSSLEKLAKIYKKS